MRIHAPLLAMVAVGLLFVGDAFAQQRVNPTFSRQRFDEANKQVAESVKQGAIHVAWLDDGKAFEFSLDGKKYRYDIATGEKKEVDPNAPPPAAPATPSPRPYDLATPPRATQFHTTLAPDAKHLAVCLDDNLWLCNLENHAETPITTDGSERKHIHYARANWAYGEELFQHTAMWWSPDSRKIAFYRFDESKCDEFFMALNQTQTLDTFSAVRFNLAGMANPEVDLLVYDLNTGKTAKLDVRDGQPFDNSSVGHYVYDISWTKDGSELLFHRCNRRQNLMELCAGDPATGKCRAVVREEWPASWVENSPPIRFLDDGKRFIWTSERNGWKNYYLYELSGKLLATLTNHEADVENIVQLNEKAGKLFYMAHDGDNPHKLQLHVVGLDGQGEKRLTDPAFYHSANVAPDGSHFIDILQTHDAPAATNLMDTEGKKLAELAKGDMTEFDKLGLRRVELFKFKAGDGQTDLYGMLHFPKDFDAKNKYPLLVDVYGGPDTVGAHETFMLPNALTDCGFLVASFDARTANGRGKRFKDAVYLKLGRVEADDQAAGVKSLCEREYVDAKRVGIFGTSYGGTMSAMCILRYPDVFHASCACAALTDFRNYDTIYAERYMWIPQENKAGYDAACIMNYADKLQGKLMIFFGSSDDNVHPGNALQLIGALQRAGKSFEVQVGPDQGHCAIDFNRMMEFFCKNLSAEGN